MSKSFTMPTGYELKIARRVFELKYADIVRVVRCRVKSRLTARGVSLSRSEQGNLVDDAVARSWITFCRLLARKTNSPADCAVFAAGIAAKNVTSRRTPALGSERTKGYEDALDHRGSLKAIGLDDLPGKHYVSALSSAEACAALDRAVAALPANLRVTAEFASRGVTQEDSAAIQGCTPRTVKNHYSAIRSEMTYSVLCHAVVEAALPQ